MCTMAFICRMTVMFCVLSAAVHAQIEIKPAKLPFKGYQALQPFIDPQTMRLHYGTHYAGYVSKLNTALADAKANGVEVTATDLTSLIKSVSILPAALSSSVRSQGGGAWNHALYFKHLAPSSNPSTLPGAISSGLNEAIMQSFGSVDAMKAQLTEAASKVFGSGWAWLCFKTGEIPLAITTTPNQDNPLMGDLPATPALTAPGCTPILGIDVWEHAYYLKYKSKRAEYLTAFWKVLSWKAVSENYANAEAGKVNAMVV